MTSDPRCVSPRCAAGLGGGPGRTKPGAVFPQPAEGDFSRPDVPVNRPGCIRPGATAVARQEEEGELQEEQIRLQGAKTLLITGSVNMCVMLKQPGDLRFNNKKLKT